MIQNVPVWPQMALKHLPWEYYMILCHVGPPKVTHQMIFALVLGLALTQILYRRKINDIGAENLTKITANVQKRRSRPR